jgi:mannose-1-phosphate guanylyltransferase
MVVVNADHEVDRSDRVCEAVRVAGEELSGGALGVDHPLVMFGVQPSSADRELTYIQPSYNDGARVDGHRVYRVSVVEPKPEKTRTRQLFESGTTYWSAGMYVWQGAAITEALQRYTPLFTMLGPAYRSELALAAAYDRLQPVSIEEGVLAGAARDGSVLTVPLDVGWRERSN